MKRGFGSDNHSGISPEVLEAIAEANINHALAYGDDEYCERVEKIFKEQFGEQASVFFVFNGTGANTLSIDAMCRSHEAVVFLNPGLARDFKYRRKQALQLCSKMRFLAVQFEAYFKDDLWRRNAEHSNKMAQLLYNKVKDIPFLKVMYPVQANGVFVQLPRETWTELQKHYFFYDWDLDNDVVRWLCSFDTTEEDIENFVEKLKLLTY